MLDHLPLVMTLKEELIYQEYTEERIYLDCSERGVARNRGKLEENEEPKTWKELKESIQGSIEWDKKKGGKKKRAQWWDEECKKEKKKLTKKLPESLMFPEKRVPYYRIKKVYRSTVTVQKLETGVTLLFVTTFGMLNFHSQIQPSTTYNQ